MNRILLLCVLCIAWCGAKADLDMSLNISNSSQTTKSFDEATGVYSFVSTGTDPYVYTNALTRDLGTLETKLTFEYISKTGIEDLVFYYCNPLDENRSAWMGNLTPTTEWKTAELDLMADVTAFGFGKEGTYLRFDFGSKSGRDIKIRNMKMTNIVPNVTGRVYCSGVGMEGVVVSDGYTMTKTDADGNYQLYSNKKDGHVFVQIPSGYMPRIKASTATNETRIFPQFYTKLSYPNTINKVEKINFEMMVENNTKFRMLVGADPQFSNRNTDLKMFETLFFPLTVQEYKEAQEAGEPIYSTYMGDLAWDNYWYSKSFAHPQYRAEFFNNYNFYKIRHFSVMGNHDNDGATTPTDSTDYMAEKEWRQFMGPTYYSYNIGNVHFMALDDIIYKNQDTGGSYSTGIVGSRNYDEGFSMRNVNFTKRDLAMVDKDKIIVLCMHAPMYYISDINQTTVSYNRVNQSLIDRAIMPFNNVMIWSGHRHVTYNMNPKNYPNVMEHSLNQMGGDLYASVYYSSLFEPNSQNVGRPVSHDGSVGSYQMFYFDGDKVTWMYKALEKDNNGQFHVFDGNSLKKFWASDETMQKVVKAESALNYSSLPDNSVLVNVFNYDPKWKVEVFEGSSDKSLAVSGYKCRDAYHILAADYYYYKKNNKLPSSVTGYNYHTFIAKTSSPTTPVTVQVTDRFGNIFKRTITRPHEVSLDAMAVGENKEEVILTGVSQHNTKYCEAKIYTSGSDIVINAQKAGSAMITTLDGKSTIVNLAEGNNRFASLGKGICIVTVNGVSKKLFVK